MENKLRFLYELQQIDSALDELEDAPAVAGTRLMALASWTNRQAPHAPALAAAEKPLGQRINRLALRKFGSVLICP